MIITSISLLSLIGQKCSYIRNIPIALRRAASLTHYLQYGLKKHHYFFNKKHLDEKNVKVFFTKPSQTLISPA